MIFSIFSVLLKLLLVLLAIVLVLLCLILFIPVRYEIRGEINDPDGSSDFDAQKLLYNSKVHLKVSWLLHFLGVRLDFPGSGKPDLRILWFHPSLKPVSRKQKKNAPSEDKNSSRKRGIYDSIVKKLKAAYWLFRKQRTQRAVRKAAALLRRFAGLLLPRRWNVEGTAGLGDPAAGAKLFEVLGLLYPWTAGHMDIQPEFMLYQFDLHFHAKGKLYLFMVLVLLLEALTDRDIRSLAAKTGALRREEKAPREKRKNGRGAARAAQRGESNV